MKRTKYHYSIYMIVSPSNKKYIGITMRSVQVRWKCHWSDANGKSDRIFCRAIRKYGKDSFMIRILKKVNTRKEALAWEIYYIGKYGTLWPNGYNMTLEGGGAGVPGFKVSDEVKKKLSKSRILFYQDEENRKAQSRIITKVYNTEKGKEQQRQRALLQNDPEIKEKIKIKLKLIRSTEEYRQAKSIEQKEVWKNPIHLKTLSDAVKKQYENGRVTWNKGIKTGKRLKRNKHGYHSTL